MRYESALEYGGRISSRKSYFLDRIMPKTSELHQYPISVMHFKSSNRLKTRKGVNWRSRLRTRKVSTGAAILN